MFSAIRNTRILIVHVNKKDNTDVNTWLSVFNQNVTLRKSPVFTVVLDNSWSNRVCIFEIEIWVVFLDCSAMRTKMLMCTSLHIITQCAEVGCVSLL